MVGLKVIILQLGFAGVITSAPAILPTHQMTGGEYKYIDIHLK